MMEIYVRTEYFKIIIILVVMGICLHIAPKNSIKKTHHCSLELRNFPPRISNGPNARIRISDTYRSERFTVLVKYM